MALLSSCGACAVVIGAGPWRSTSWLHLHRLLLIVPVQEKMELLSLPLANERRPCVLVGRDNMALPASLISQIGYRCHPSLYAEGDPGEKVELVAGRTTNACPALDLELRVVLHDVCVCAQVQVCS